MTPGTTAHADRVSCGGSAAQGKSLCRGVPVHAEQIHHAFGSFAALRGLSISIDPGEFVSLLGPSGSGKTTLLRIISGLLRPQSGRVLINDRDVTRLPADKRNIGFVFQNYALFPNLTVFDNVAFPLRLRRFRGDELRLRVASALERVFLTGLEGRYPSELSGGQQQRVAVARAIVFDPTVLLMDEPLGSLDKRLRQQLQLELRNLQREVGITTVYVTHDQEEAFALSDRIAVINEGELRQFADPEAIYLSPADSFVAHFVGDLNYLEGRMSDSPAGPILRTAGNLSIRVDACASSGRAGQLMSCGIRPEHLKLDDAECENRYPARLRNLRFRGNHYWAELLLSSGDILAAMLPSANRLVEGQEVLVGWNARDSRLFPVNKREREET